MKWQAISAFHRHLHHHRAQKPASLCAVLNPPPTSGQIKHITASKGIRRPVIPKLFAESSAVSLPLPFFFNRCGPSTEAMNVSRIRYTAGGSGWDMPQGARRVGRRRHLETIHHAKLSKFREMDITDDSVDRCSSIWYCELAAVWRMAQPCVFMSSRLA